MEQPVNKLDAQIMNEYKSQEESEEKTLEDMTKQLETDEFTMPQDFQDIFNSEGLTLEMMEQPKFRMLFSLAVALKIKVLEKMLENKNDPISLKELELLKRTTQRLSGSPDT